jgi:alpha-L-fucosidase
MIRFLNRFTLHAILFFWLYPGVASASIPDTIHVITHNRTVVVTDPSKGVKDHRGWGVFPAPEVLIRKIIMHVTFACPDTMRCADWDYSDRIQLERAGGVDGNALNYEIARLITPYGGFFGKSWSFAWEVDVTDFSMILRDSLEVNYIHSGYEPNNDRGWLVTIDFEIITGPPAMVPLAITEIWDDHYAYGDPAKPIEQHLLPVDFNTTPGATMARLRVIQTGHGMDSPDNCAEFCSKYREFWYDGRLWDKKQLWKKCGDNPVSPQAGTWIFDRGNWCPGNLMVPETFDLPVKADGIHNLRFVMEPYTATKQNNGNQVISAYLIQYTSPAHRIDATVDDIIVPSDKDIYLRKNPAGANPVIVVKNNGTDTLRSMHIEYGTRGFELSSYPWHGKLAPQQTIEITLPGRIFGKEGANRFVVSVKNPNGKTDEYQDDNTQWSSFTPAPVHGSLLLFYLYTNNEPEHNGWQLRGSDGAIILERKPGSMKAATAYLDTFRLLPGAYSLTLTDTAGDGLEFWYNSKGGRGEARLMDGDRNLLKYFESDCGSGWLYHFVVGDSPKQTNPNDRAISLYPTRTSEISTLHYFANNQADVVARLITDPGAEVVEERTYPQLKEGIFPFDLRRFPYGRFYLKVYIQGEEVFSKRIRFVAPEPEGEVRYEWPADSLVSKKLHQWQDWKFGVIIHWGAYSKWGVVESWSLCPEDEPWCIRRGPLSNDYNAYVRGYEGIRWSFNPIDFEPSNWAKAAKRAGMKYVVFTTKHHDGFCMYDTRQTDYKITDPGSAFSLSPKADISKEVFNAFRAEGLAAGVYFSKPDWHNDDYWWPYFPVTDRNVNYDPKKYPERWKNFQAFTYRQIEELMTGYGDVDILWLDGGWVRPEGSLTEETRPWLGKNQYVQDIDMPAIAAMARAHQPGLLIVDRTVHGDFENYRTPEQQIPEKMPDYPWESCITLGSSWYHTGPAEQYKSSTWAIHTLVKIVAKGGNLLLGIGPDETGEMPTEVYQTLEEIGEWMDVNSEAIYETKPLAPYQEGEFCFTQSKDEKTRYAFLLKREGEALSATITLPDGFIGTHESVALLGYEGKLRVKTVKGKRVVTLSKKITSTLSESPVLVFWL